MSTPLKQPCRGPGGAYQDLGFHRWPVDIVGLLVDHDRLGDGGYARALVEAVGLGRMSTGVNLKRGPREEVGDLG